MPLRIFVTDGDQRPALAIVRALGRRGATVIVGEEMTPNLAASSRYCARGVIYPSPYRDRHAFDSFLLDFVRRERPDVVIPVTDVTTHAVCRNQDVLGRFTSLAVPPFESFELVSNKDSLLDRAKFAGIRTPRTLCVSSADEIDRVRHEIGYPVVIKPLRSKVMTESGWTMTNVRYADDEQDLRRELTSKETRRCGPWLIQERIIGPGVGVFGLFDRGELVAEFAHRRLREKPPSGGVSVLCESMPLPPGLRSEAARLLGPLGWHGVAMVEYKHDSNTGDFVLMEVNGRFWGSLQLAIDSGIDFPFLACELARGHRPVTAPTYTTGVRSRWVFGDLDHLLLRLFGRDRIPCVRGAPSRTRLIVDFFTERRARNEINRREDPGPARYEIRRYASALVRSVSDRCVRKAVHRHTVASIPALESK
jgi:predicted ATP-grasp superfamily ATP-dependent carboligase